MSAGVFTRWSSHDQALIVRWNNRALLSCQAAVSYPSAQASTTRPRHDRVVILDALDEELAQSLFPSSLRTATLRTLLRSHLVHSSSETIITPSAEPTVQKIFCVPSRSKLQQGIRIQTRIPPFVAKVLAERSNDRLMGPLIPAGVLWLALARRILDRAVPPPPTEEARHLIVFMNAHSLRLLSFDSHHCLEAVRHLPIPAALFPSPLAPQNTVAAITWLAEVLNESLRGPRSNVRFNNVRLADRAPREGAAHTSLFVTVVADHPLQRTLSEQGDLLSDRLCHRPTNLRLLEPKEELVAGPLPPMVPPHFSLDDVLVREALILVKKRPLFSGLTTFWGRWDPLILFALAGVRRLLWLFPVLWACAYGLSLNTHHHRQTIDKLRGQTRALQEWSERDEVTMHGLAAEHLRADPRREWWPLAQACGGYLVAWHWFHPSNPGPRTQLTVQAPDEETLQQIHTKLARLYQIVTLQNIADQRDPVTRQRTKMATFETQMPITLQDQP